MADILSWFRTAQYNHNKKLDLVLLALLACVVLFTLRYLFPTGVYDTHDILYHVIRQIHFFKELSHGQFPVRWADDMAYGLGYPIFNNAYVFPYYFASLIHLFGWGFGDSLKTVILISSLLATLGWYCFLRFHFGRFASFIGAAIFWLAPYHFLMVFVSGQVGTITSWMWMPFVMIGLELMLQKKARFKNSTIVGLCISSIAFGGLITTHLITSFPLLPLMVVYVLYHTYLLMTEDMTRREKVLHIRNKFLLLLTFTLLSLGLSAFYLLPAMHDLQFVRGGHEAIIVYSDHFPTLKQLLYSAWGYGYSNPGEADGMSFQIGFAQLAALGLGVGAIGVWALRKVRGVQFKQKQTDILVVCGVISAGICIFLMLSVSQPVWQMLTFLQTIQHPWRLLVGVVLTSSILAAYFSSTKYGRLIGLTFVVLALFNTRNYMRPMDVRYRSDAEIMSKREFKESGDIGLEFLPIWATAPTNSENEPIAFLVTKELDQENPYAPVTLNVNEATNLTFHKYYFPHWRVKDNGMLVSTKPNDSGLLSIHVEKGEHTIQLIRGETPVAKFGNALSLISSIGVLGLLIYIWRTSRT